MSNKNFEDIADYMGTTPDTGPTSTRNMAMAVMQQSKAPQPVYTKWTIQNAVKDGYRVNPWVYRSVYLKAKAGSSVPWYVVNAEGEKLDNHPLTKMFKRPNPFISKQDLFELIISWLELAGNSYLKRVEVGGRTEELWPISPDRLHPIPTDDPLKWMEGYALDQDKTSTYTQEEVIHHKYFNPANPLLGISPLEAVAKTVDIDNGQKDFNKSTTQNRGIIDGVFTFDRKFTEQKQTDAIRDKLNEVHRQKRTFGVLGSNAKYIRTALTPAEQDFIGSGKANREEVFIAFGVPPVYAGVMDGATMNNYKTSELVFWFGTMLFLLDDLADTFNFSLDAELAEGEKIVYDISQVPAIREAMLAKAKTAKALYEMGVPFDQLNKVFSFGFDEYEGWDKSNPSTSSKTDPVPNDSAVRSTSKYTLIERRETDNEMAIEAAVLDRVPAFYDVLQTQQEAVFDALNEGRGADLEKVIGKTDQLMAVVVGTTYRTVAVDLGSDMVLEKRGIEEDLTAEVDRYLAAERTVLTEVSFINSTTVDKLLAQVRSAMDTGMTTAELQQSIVDTGLFNDSRALMLSRTISGNAASLGQFKGAALGGADEKTWSTSGHEVRKSHKKLDGETIPIDEYFRVGKDKALYP